MPLIPATVIGVLLIGMSVIGLSLGIGITVGVCARWVRDVMSGRWEQLPLSVLYGLGLLLIAYYVGTSGLTMGADILDGLVARWSQ